MSVNLRGMGSVMSTRPLRKSTFHDAPHHVIHDEPLVGDWRLQVARTEGGEHAEIRLVSPDGVTTVYCLHRNGGDPIGMDAAVPLDELGRLFTRAILAIEG